MQSLGPIFRNLRLEKQLTLKDTAKGIVSQPFLSNFETGKSGISADKLFALLQRLKVSPEEFYRLASFYNSVSIYEFLNSLAPGLVNEDIYFLNKKLEELNEKKENFDSIFYTHFRILIEQSINLYSNTPLNTAEINIISQYLLYNDNWGNYEIHLYANFIKFIPLKINKILIKKSKKSASQYVGKENYKHSVVLIYINFINHLIRENELLFANDLIDNIMKDLINTKYFYEITKLNYLKGKLTIAQGNIEDGLKIAQKSIDIMYNLEAFSIAQAHKKALKDFIDSLES